MDFSPVILKCLTTGKNKDKIIRSFSSNSHYFPFPSVGILSVGNILQSKKDSVVLESQF